MKIDTKEHKNNIEKGAASQLLSKVWKSKEYNSERRISNYRFVKSKLRGTISVSFFERWEGWGRVDRIHRNLYLVKDVDINLQANQRNVF